MLFLPRVFNSVEIALSLHLIIKWRLPAAICYDVIHIVQMSVWCRFIDVLVAYYCVKYLRHDAILLVSDGELSGVLLSPEKV